MLLTTNLREIRVMKFLKILLVFLFLLSLSSFVNAQIVKGYFPYYRSTTDVDNVQFNKVTDIIYAFADISATGTLTIHGPGGAGDLSLFNYLKTKCTANNVRLWVAIGGPGFQSNFSSSVSSAANRTTFANSCLSLCSTYGLAGVDIDWEFPLSTDAANLTTAASLIKTTFGTTYKLSAALGGEAFNYLCVSIPNAHTNGIQAALFNYLDEVNIMTYDGPTCLGSHTSLDFMTHAMDGWNALGCPYTKMYPGMAFYTRGGGAMWSSFATPARFTNPTGIDSGTDFDSEITIQEKINEAMCVKGAPGVMVWELSQDLPGSNPLNLTSVMWTAAQSCGCPFSDPNLGPDQSLCGVSSITLASGIAAASGRTFSWTKDGSAFAGSSPNNTVTVAGTYQVTITDGTCTKSAQIVISASLPTPDLGPDNVICDPATYDLTPSNASSFPSGTTWQWKKDGTDISGATSSTLSNVRIAGVYRLTASISGCPSTLDDITLTSSLPTPVDGCNSSAPIALSITNASAGPYTWYNVSTGGASLATGTSYSAPSAGTYYVQDGVTAPPYYVGLAGPANSFQNPTGTGIGINFTTTNTVTINSVDVYVPSGASGNLQIVIRNSANTADVVVGPITAVNNVSGAMLKVTVPVGGSLPAGTYKMVDEGNINLQVNSAPTYPLTNNDVSITGSYGLGSYAFFFNWQIAGSGSACKRLPVVASIGSCNVSAPVELISFTAAQQEGEVILNWSTASEISNAYYKVERSSDSENFLMLGKVQGSGNTSSRHDYNYLDETPEKGKIYYRLTQYDLDGTAHYSQLVSINLGIYSVIISPNPFSSSTSVMMQSETQVSECIVTDLQGREINRFLLSSGKSIEMGSELPSGIYILKIISSSVINTFRLIKE
jgi:GH18 family chitinase